MKIDEKINDLSLLHCIENSKLYIEHLNSRINFYEKQIILNKDNSLAKEYEEKILDNYNKINEELNYIWEIHQTIKKEKA